MSKGNWRSLLFAVCWLSSGFVQAATEAIESHVLTLEIKSGGMQIMSPTVELLPDKVATVGVTSPQTGEKYSLQLLVKPHQVARGIENVVSIEAKLFSGDDLKDLLADPVLFIRPGQGGRATINSHRGEILVNVISHAIKNRQISDEQRKSIASSCDVSKKLSSSTTDAPLLSASSNGIFEQTESSKTPKIALDDCCSVGCMPGPGTLSCCNVVWCCACNVCCQPY